jgi:integrase
MFLQLDKSIKKVFPYSIDQLNVIFSSPLFTSCRGDGFEAEPGNVRIRNWRYWIGLIGLYTGARLGEIAQLHVADVREIRGEWCFHVTAEGATDKAVKTAGSERVVPMHPELIRIGLLDYHAAMTAQGKPRLFPEIKPDARGFLSGVPSRFFNDYFRSIGVKDGKSQNFHSFRHGIADAFRRAGYLDEQFGCLLGHVKASTTQRYGILAEGDLATRVAMIRAVEFPGLSLGRF